MIHGAEKRLRFYLCPFLQGGCVMKSVAWFLLVAFVCLFVAESVSEARCGGRRGLFRGQRPVRTFFQNHRLFHR